MRILKQIYPTARVPHRCDLCGGIINPGEKYERTTVSDDGRVSDSVTHIHCSKLINMLDMDEYYEGVLIEDYECIVQDYVSDNHRDDPKWNIKASQHVQEWFMTNFVRRKVRYENNSRS